MINRTTAGLIKNMLFKVIIVIIKMKFVRHAKKLRIRNFDKTIEKEEKIHSDLFPNNVRCLIVGSSGVGKTNIMLNLLFDANGLRFENVYVFSKSLYQAKYKFLETVLSDIPEITYFKFSENDQMVSPDETKSNSVIIFDDIVCEQQDNIRNHFIICRHKKNNVIYICQTYARIPKHLIRDNANFIIVFQQDELNLKHIYSDHVNSDMTFETFKDICAKAWSRRKKGFIVIDKESDMKSGGRYRFDFDIYINDL